MSAQTGDDQQRDISQRHAKRDLKNVTGMAPAMKMHMHSIKSKGAGDRLQALGITPFDIPGLRWPFIAEVLLSGVTAARVYVQNEATSVVWGMPGFVAKAG